ncbi:MAG: GFA family protein [Pseudomonadota bacterium]
MAKVTKGSCNCGGVKWEVEGELRDIIACHCGQCRKQTGSFYAATSAPDDKLTLTNAGTLKWYKSSGDAKRGFCGECGSAMFWKYGKSDSTTILVGSVDGPTGLEIAEHIFTKDKPDWYQITDGKPIREDW